MNELSLFSGAGGGLLGTKLLGFRHIGYVENNDYCERVIAQRIKDGILDDAPIFGDIRTFLDSGSAEFYRGAADIITAGFPCQPFSVAGKRKAESDSRNLWPETIRVIRGVRPAFVLLENVPGLLATDYIYGIMDDIAEAGYEAFPPIKLGACDIGANHIRKRAWIFAYAKCLGRNERAGKEIRSEEQEAVGQNIGNICKESRPNSPILDRNANGGNGNKRAIPEMEERKDSQSSRVCQKMAYAHKSGFQDRGQTGLSQGTKRNPEAYPATQRRGDSWWSVEPPVGRVAHGVANRVDRLKAIGNGQVPRVVQTVWSLIFNEAHQEV